VIEAVSKLRSLVDVRDGNGPQCPTVKPDGTACRMRPLRSARFCYSHDPEHAAEAADARRLGGKRRRRERFTATAFRVQGVDTIKDIRRVLEIALLDTLDLESSVARSRALFWGCTVLVRLREVGELEDRLEALEAALRTPQRPRGTP
jgi:hypothetical protein